MEAFPMAGLGAGFREFVRRVMEKSKTKAPQAFPALQPSESAPQRRKKAGAESGGRSGQTETAAPAAGQGAAGKSRNPSSEADEDSLQRPKGASEGVKIRVLLSYEGTHFAGWQRQKRERTVQGEVEKAVSELFQLKIPVIGSGRTDRGVHALGQTAHFEIPEQKLKNKNLIQALNHITAEDISFHKAWKAPMEFHSRFSAERKTYIFFLSTGKTPSALFRRFVSWRKVCLDLDKLNELAAALQGRFDFKSFQNAGSSVSSTVQTVYTAHWRRLRPSLWRFSITGTGFLRRMVRNIVGAQIELACKGRKAQDLRQILERKDRSCAFSPAESRGLFLKEVFYPKKLDRRCILL